MTGAAVMAPQRAREEKNRKFANDGSYESVELQLKGLARKFYVRVSTQGLSLTFDDCMQEVNLAYVQARAKWNPERGVLFTTYCQTVVRNNLNDRIHKEARDRSEMGMYPTGIGPGQVLEGGENIEESAERRRVDLVDEEPAASCEDILQGRQEFHARMRSLSPSARRLVLSLLMDEKQTVSELPVEQRPAPPKLRELAKRLGLTGEELRQVKLEILAKFGVAWR